MIMLYVRAHDRIFTAKGSTMVLEPQNIEDKDIDKLRDIKILIN